MRNNAFMPYFLQSVLIKLVVLVINFNLSANTHHKSVVQHVLGPLEVNRQQIDLFLLVKEMPVITLTSVSKCYNQYGVCDINISLYYKLC